MSQDQSRSGVRPGRVVIRKNGTTLHMPHEPINDSAELFNQDFRAVLRDTEHSDSDDDTQSHIVKPYSKHKPVTCSKRESPPACKRKLNIEYEGMSDCKAPKVSTPDFKNLKAFWENKSAGKQSQSVHKDTVQENKTLGEETCVETPKRRLSVHELTKGYMEVVEQNVSGNNTPCNLVQKDLKEKLSVTGDSVYDYSDIDTPHRKLSLSEYRKLNKSPASTYVEAEMMPPPSDFPTVLLASKEGGNQPSAGKKWKRTPKMFDKKVLGEDEVFSPEDLTPPTKQSKRRVKTGSKRRLLSLDPSIYSQLQVPEYKPHKKMSKKASQSNENVTNSSNHTRHESDNLYSGDKTSPVSVDVSTNGHVEVKYKVTTPDMSRTYTEMSALEDTSIWSEGSSLAELETSKTKVQTSDISISNISPIVPVKFHIERPDDSVTLELSEANITPSLSSSEAPNGDKSYVRNKVDNMIGVCVTNLFDISKNHNSELDKSSDKTSIDGGNCKTPGQISSVSECSPEALQTYLNGLGNISVEKIERVRSEKSLVHTSKPSDKDYLAEHILFRSQDTQLSGSQASLDTVQSLGSSLSGSQNRSQPRDFDPCLSPNIGNIESLVTISPNNLKPDASLSPTSIMGQITDISEKSSIAEPENCTLACYEDWSTFDYLASDDTGSVCHNDSSDEGRQQNPISTSPVNNNSKDNIDSQQSPSEPQFQLLTAVRLQEYRGRDKCETEQYCSDEDSDKENVDIHSACYECVEYTTDESVTDQCTEFDSDSSDLNTSTVAYESLDTTTRLVIDTSVSDAESPYSPTDSCILVGSNDGSVYTVYGSSSNDGSADTIYGSSRSSNDGSVDTIYSSSCNEGSVDTPPVYTQFRDEQVMPNRSYTSDYSPQYIYTLDSSNTDLHNTETSVNVDIQEGISGATDVEVPNYEEHVNTAMYNLVSRVYQYDPKVGILERDETANWKEIGVGGINYCRTPSTEASIYAYHTWSNSLTNQASDYLNIQQNQPMTYNYPDIGYTPLDLTTIRTRETCVLENSPFGSTVTYDKNRPVDQTLFVNQPMSANVLVNEPVRTVLPVTSNSRQTSLDTTRGSSCDLFKYMEQSMREKIVERKSAVTADSSSNELSKELEGIRPYIISGCITTTYLMSVIQKTDLMNDMFELAIDENGKIKSWVLDKCRKTNAAVLAKDLVFRLFTLKELQSQSIQKLSRKKLTAIKNCLKKTFPDKYTAREWISKCVPMIKSALSTLFKHRVRQVQEFCQLHGFIPSVV